MLFFLLLASPSGFMPRWKLSQASLHSPSYLERVLSPAHTCCSLAGIAAGLAPVSYQSLKPFAFFPKQPLLTWPEQHLVSLFYLQQKGTRVAVAELKQPLLTTALAALAGKVKFLFFVSLVKTNKQTNKHALIFTPPVFSPSEEPS